MASVLAVMLMSAPSQARPSALALEPVALSFLAGWPGPGVGEAWEAFRRSCAEIIEEGRAFARPSLYGGAREDWQPLCRRALATEAGAAAAFFAAEFVALRVEDEGTPEGLFTGYFEPEYRGSRMPGPEFPVPVYRRPADLIAFDAETEAQTGLRYGRLVAGVPAPYASRREIEEGALAGQGLEIAWLASPVDAFFMHVQGSARLRLPDGGLMRLAYAGKSGLAYTSIGRLLAERGILAREAVTMDAIREWMAANPAAATDLMRENESYVFFREVEIGDPVLGPPGAQLVGLVPEASLAVDRRYWTYGTPVWLDTVVPAGSGEEARPFRRLTIAQDTGSAIRGAVRGDIFFGSGDEAGRLAGRMRAPGTMVVLLPRAVVQRLGLASP